MRGLKLTCSSRCRALVQLWLCQTPDTTHPTHQQYSTHVPHNVMLCDCEESYAVRLRGKQELLALVRVARPYLACSSGARIILVGSLCADRHTYVRQFGIQLINASLRQGVGCFMSRLFMYLRPTTKRTLCRLGLSPGGVNKMLV